MTGKKKNIVIVGGTNIDDVIILDGAMPQDAKVSPAYSNKSLGGGGANSALALRILGRIFEQDDDLTLITKIGHGKENQFVSDVLNHGENITTIDAIKGQYAEVPHNTVISHTGGRAIFRRAEFNYAALAIEEDKELEIEKAVKDADLVLIQTKHPDIALMAAQKADAYNVPAVVDFSNKECPDILLAYCTFALIPAEFRFTAMPENSSDHDLLEYAGKHIPYAAISDASKDTRRAWNGQEARIPSLQVNTRDSLGAGDLRDAAFMYFLARENEPDEALHKANIIASLSCEYYGREWEHDLTARLKGFAIFDNDFPDAVPVAAPAP